MKQYYFLVIYCVLISSGTVGGPSKQPSLCKSSITDEYISTIGMPVDGVLPVLGSHLYGLDVNTGEILWNGTNGYCSDLVSDAGVLFIGQGARAVEAKTGKELWSVKTEAPGGHHSVKYGKLLIAESTYCRFAELDYDEWTSLMAFNEFTGDHAWTFDASSTVESRIGAGEGLVVFGCEDGTVYALNHKTGGMVWKIETGKTVRAQPIIVENKVLVSSDAVYCVDAKTGQVIWILRNGKETEYYEPLWSQPIVVENRVIVSSDAVYCVDLATGSIMWEKEFSDPYVVSASDTTVYVSTGSGYACLTIEDGTTLWISEQPGDSKKAVVNEDLLVFVISDKAVVALDTSTGENQWIYDVSERVTYVSLLVGNVIVIGTKSGDVIALSTPEHEPPAKHEELLDSAKRSLFRRDYPGALKKLEEARTFCTEKEDLLEINILIEYALNQQKKEWMRICLIVAGVAALTCFLAMRKKKMQSENIV
jgi:outer membrane protein assembly factor BamB